MENIFLRDLHGNLSRIPTDNNTNSLKELKIFIQEQYSIPISYQRLWKHGYLLSNDNVSLSSLNINNDYMEIELTLSLNGGKGGFGSLLRAAGKINRTTNHSSMRDLSGRRLKYIQQEEELSQWLEEQKKNPNH